MHKLDDEKEHKEGSILVDASSLLTHNCGDIAGSTTIIKSNPSIYKQIPAEVRKKQGGIMVYMANTYILPLHDAKHTDEEIKRFNERGLDIFLYEPLCSYLEQDPDALTNGFNCGFYSEYGNDTNYEINRAAELDSISFYAHQNGLTNVTVWTGDYNVGKYFPFYSEQLNLQCDDLFLRGLVLFDHIIAEPKSKDEIIKTFVSTNWRFTPVRAFMSALLTNHDTHLAWFYKVDDSMFDQVIWFRHRSDTDEDKLFYKDLIFGLDKLNNKSPHCLDKYTETAVPVDEPLGHFYPMGVKGFDNEANPVAVNAYRLGLQPFYREAFIDVLCESRYAQPTANISEKTTQAIQYRTPFLLLAPPHTLEYIRDLGFKTFDKWWDESYDQEEDHYLRMRAVYAIIKDLSNKSHDELYEMYMEMQDVLNYNVDRLLSYLGKPLQDHKQIKWHTLVDYQWAGQTLNENHEANLPGSAMQSPDNNG